MTDLFDPYLQWLGIRDPERPPNHYRLLGIDLFESDSEIISNAADRQMSHVRTNQSGPNAEESQVLLNQLAAAKICLLKPARKAEYDKRLRLLIEPRTARPNAKAKLPPIASSMAECAAESTTVTLPTDVLPLSARSPASPAAASPAQAPFQFRPVSRPHVRMNSLGPLIVFVIGLMMFAAVFGLLTAIRAPQNQPKVANRSAGSARRTSTKTNVAPLKKQAANRPAKSIKATSDAFGPLVAIELVSGVSMSLRQVPAGTFWMGSPPTEPGRNDDETLHEVTIANPFFLGMTEITQSQWDAVLGKEKNRSEPQGADLPANNVSWYDAVRFCDALNRSPVGTAYRFRLPAEAEWEYACRAGTDSAYPWGSEAAPMREHAWVAANSQGKVHPVGQLHPNSWGFYDMVGNVYEWTERSPFAAEQANMGQPQSTVRSMLRGGYWGSRDAETLRSAHRRASTGGNQRNFAGMRIAADAL